MSSGKFNTSTKNKLTTKYGKILKVTHYESDEAYPIMEYKIRPICSICGGDVGCVCYNNDNSDDEPYDAAIKGLQQKWCCEKSHCICEFMKEYNSEKYKKLVKKYGNDEQSISDNLLEEFVDSGEDIFCEV